MMFDLDRQLILALQENGRATNVELAGQLGVHVATIAKRIELLEANGIMKVRALPNPFKLGYSAQAFIAIETDSHLVEEICSRLNRNFNINLLVTAFGHYDILAIAYYQTWEQLLHMVSTDLATLPNVRIDTFLIKEVKKRSYGFPLGDLSPVKIDDLDQKIIEKLTEDGRIKSQHLAEELGISPPACLRRITRLIYEKVIVIKAVPNPSKIGYSANAFMMLRVRPDKIDKVCSELASYKDVYLVMTLFNSYDILFSFNAVIPEELYACKNKFLSIDGVTDNEVIIRAEIKKRYYGGFLK